MKIFKELLVKFNKVFLVFDAVASYVNMKIREQTNLLKMIEIQKALIGFNEGLTVPHRKFLRQGPLIKVNALILQ